jgi:hypothetical protein
MARVFDRKVTVDDLHNDVQPPGARMRLVHKPADYEDLNHLSESEKELAGKVLVNYLEHFGTEAPHWTSALLNDPELYVAVTGGTQAIRKLLDDAYLADDPQVRGPVADLMYVNIMKHHRCQQGMETYIENYVGRETYDPRKTVLIDFPDSDVFSPEERLAIKFSKAVLENTMTDELFDEALERWGVKMTLRYISFIGEYLKSTLILDTLGLTGAYNGNPAEYRHGYKDYEAHGEEGHSLQTWQEEIDR